MAKSRITGLLLALAAASLPAAAPAQTAAESLIARQKSGLQAATGTRRCPTGGDEGEIVVCGQAQSPYRLPLPVEPLPGEVVRGEVPSPVALLKEDTCTTVGQARGCPAFDILGIGLMIGKIVVEQAIKKVVKED
jgi:hypothetical protein